MDSDLEDQENSSQVKVIFQIGYKIKYQERRIRS